MKNCKFENYETAVNGLKGEIDRMRPSVAELERMGVEDLDRAIARVASMIEESRLLHLRLMAARPGALDRARALERMREHLAFRVFRLDDHPIGCCASPPDERGGFWVGAGPLERAGLPVAGKLLVAYEYVRQGRHGARRSGRTLGVPLRGMASVEFELELDRLYAGAVCPPRS